MTVTTTQTPESIDAQVAGLAARQCGVLSRAQAINLGMTSSSIQRRLRSGRWLTRHPGVYVIAGGPRFWRQDVWAATLAAGPPAVVTHEAALHLHGIHMLPRRPLTLTIPRGAHSRVAGAVVHQIDDLQPHHVITVDDLPVSTAARTVVDLAATRRPHQLARVTDEVVSAKQTSYSKIATCLHEVARRGKRGVRKLATVLDERTGGYVPPQGELEHALFTALAAAGLPSPRRQFPLPGRGAVTGLVDAAYVDARVIVEADGRRWHSRLADMRRDRERDTEAARAGWLTLRFLYEHIMDDPSEVAAAVADVLAARQ